MANPLLFRSLLRDVPLANASNQQGAAAFAFTPRHKLAQMVMTGCMNETFYASGQAQLNDVLATAKDLDDLFLAQLAIYGRERGMMKDMPALLTAILAARGSALLPVVFARVINNGRILRNICANVAQRRDRAALAGDAAKEAGAALVAGRQRRTLIAGFSGQCAVAGGYRQNGAPTATGGVAGSLLRLADW